MMTVSDLIKDLILTISDARNMGFEYISTKEVPSAYKPDSNLTYKSGTSKKGKIIETCVLYVDIRDSVKLVDKHQFDTMGKIYNAFAKSILKIADNYDAKVRNIIGDRVMVVFPSENCYTKAVQCAITINHVSGEINRIFNHVDFKCGIGIDHGKMRVIKVGTEKKSDENANYKNLIWVGYPANRASRLTDIANKEIEETYFLVESKHQVMCRNPVRFESKKVTKEMSSIEFSDLFTHGNESMIYLTNLKDIMSFEKKNRKINFPPILITDSVMKGYKNENPNCNTISEGHWSEIKHPIKNVPVKVFGSETTLKID